MGAYTTIELERSGAIATLAGGASCAFSVSVTAPKDLKVFANSPELAAAKQGNGDWLINGTLSFSGPNPPGVAATGEVGIVAYAQGVVNSSVTNFTIKQ